MSLILETKLMHMSRRVTILHQTFDVWKKRGNSFQIKNSRNTNLRDEYTQVMHFSTFSSKSMLPMGQILSKCFYVTYKHFDNV